MSESTIPEKAPKYSVCGNRIIESATHRVITTVKDGTVESKHFCDTACESFYHT